MCEGGSICQEACKAALSNQAVAIGVHVGADVDVCPVLSFEFE